MKLIAFSVFVFVFVRVLRGMIKDSESTGGSRAKSKSTSRSSAWETVSKEWENARRERLGTTSSGSLDEAAPQRSATLQLGPDPPPALERLRAELESGVEPVGSMPPPLPHALSVPDESSADSDVIELDDLKSGSVDLHELGWRDAREVVVEAPEPKRRPTPIETPHVVPAAESRLHHVAESSSHHAAKRARERAQASGMPASGMPASGANGEPELLAHLTEALEAAAAAEPASEVRYSISSSLVRPAARLLSAIRTGLAARGRPGDQALVEVARGLPMFGVHLMEGRQLDPAALAEALDALHHASPKLRSAVFASAAQLAERLQPAGGHRVVTALRTLSHTED